MRRRLTLGGSSCPDLPLSDPPHSIPHLNQLPMMGSQALHGYVRQGAHWEERPLYDCFSSGYLPGSDRQRKEDR